MDSSTDITRRNFAVKSVLGLLGLGATSLPAGTHAVNAPAGARGIYKVIRNPRALQAPVTTPAGETWRYMLSVPFQVAPKLAAVHVNLKVSPGLGQDFGGGTDIILFDRVGGLRAEQAIEVSRKHVAPNPNDDNRLAIMAKFPGIVAFVPYGARRADGSPHPHAGTGFVVNGSAAWPQDRSEGEFVTYPDRIGLTAYWGKKSYRPTFLHQLSYDGTTFRVGPPEQVDELKIVPGYHSQMTGMTPGIPDGDDLLITQCARNSAGGSGAGVQRWSRTGGAWRPGAYEPVTPDDDSIEPSLIRDLDGSLLFSARGRRRTGPPLRVWRQARSGAPWELRINVNRQLNSTPVTLNRAVDGTPFIASNFYQPEFKLPEGLHSDGGISRLEPMGWRGERSTICLWALNEARDGFDAQFVARDPRSEFGLPPHGTIWALDHPISSPVQLADGAWHALMGYRILEWKENTHLIPPSPQTGSYLDEIVSFGPPAPLWNF